VLSLKKSGTASLQCRAMNRGVASSRSDSLTQDALHRYSFHALVK